MPCTGKKGRHMLYRNVYTFKCIFYDVMWCNDMDMEKLYLMGGGESEKLKRKEKYNPYYKQRWKQL